MAKKEFTYRGKTLQELQNLSHEDFAKLLKTRARRTVLRGSLDKSLLKRVKRAHEAKLANKPVKPIRTHSRDAVILPEMVGLQYAVYRGNSFDVFEANPETVGHFMGEFIFTRKRILHGKAGIGATKSSTASATKK